ncbi:MAG: hypothetical protein Q9190_000308 [Brigantiaea leucoxantha]
MTIELDLTAAAKPKAPGWRFWAAFGSIAVNNLTAALDATMLSVALPIISTSINGTAIEAFWTGTAFLLATTVFMLNFLDLSNAFGRRPLLIFALMLFAAGAIICALCDNFRLMIGGRVVQGVGASGLMALTQVIITDMVPLRRRGDFFALISTVWALGSVCGPILGGIIAQRGAWRWIFWLNVPVIGVGILGTIAFLRLHFKERSLMTKLCEIDWIGSTLFIASVTGTLIAVSWGGVQYSWSSWHTLVPLILGVAGCGLFCLYEVKTPLPTVLPLELFRVMSTSIVYFGTVIHGMVLWSMVYYLPQYFQSVKEYDAVIAGVAALPQTLTVVPCAIIVGVLASKTGKYRWAIWTGWSLTTLGCGLLILLDVNTSVPAWIFLQLVSGIGIGLLFPSMSIAVQASCPRTHTAASATLIAFFRAFGQSVGVATGGVIFQNRMRANLLAYPDLAPLAQQYSLDVLSLIEVLKQMPSGTPQTKHLKEAFASSFHVIWAVMCALSGSAMLLNFLIHEYGLDRAHETDQGFKHTEAKAEST